MTTRHTFLTLSLVALIFLSSCGIVMGTPAGSTSVPTSGPTTDPLALIDTAAAETFSVQTQIAQAVQQTLAAMVTDTPQFTLTASSTPTPSLTIAPPATLTPIYPTVTVSAETNCRSGPGLVYDLLGVLYPGETTEVVQRATVPNYWLVRNPDNPTQFCWLWGQYATVVGDWQSLPQATPPPTPTPSAGFTLQYLSTVHCVASYGFRVKILNTGTVTWKSYKVVTKDATTATTTAYSSDLFIDLSGCAVGNTLQDLEHNEEGISGNWGGGVLNYNPAGHSITMTFTLCTGDALTGDCDDKSITFTP